MVFGIYKLNKKRKRKKPRPIKAHRAAEVI